MSTVPTPVPESPLPPRVEANRENALLSTGPSTPEGKAAIRFNALKHGACAQTLLLPSEDAAAFEALGQSLHEFWQVDGPVEQKYLDRIHECEWRLARIRTADTNLCAAGLREWIHRFEDEPDPIARRAFAEVAARKANASQFVQIRRQESALLREHDRLEQTLNELIAGRVTPAIEAASTSRERRNARAAFEADASLNAIEREIRRAQAPSYPLPSTSARAGAGFVPHKPAPVVPFAVK